MIIMNTREALNSDVYGTYERGYTQQTLYFYKMKENYFNLNYILISLSNL